MIEKLYELLGITAEDLPYFGEEVIFIFCLTLLFFGALAFFNAILKIIFGILPGKDH